MDIPTLLQKYDRPVPRYTSYPTAINFNDDIPQSYYTDLLTGLSSAQPVSLYLHIPFCHVLCHYCGCHTKVVNGYSPVKAYVQTLLREIDLVGRTISRRITVSQLHFGGGSPNFLETDDLQDIMKALAQYFDFNKNAEIAMETDPRLLDNDKIKTLTSLGFTRISLGIQDFDPTVQTAVNRIQPFENVQKIVLNLRAAGINKINFDLMIGLPLQTVESVTKSVEQAISLCPDRLAVFAYAHVPWIKKQQRLLEKYPLPDTQTRFDMMVCVKNTLKKAGYHAIGIDHFAHENDSLFQAHKMGTLRRNFQGYTDDQAQTILGLGLSSISMFSGTYVQNMSDIPTYRRAVEGGEFPIGRGCVLSKEDRRRRAVIEQIMCGYKTDFSAYPEAVKKLKMLQQEQIVNIDAAHIQITEKGWPFARIVASCLDTYYEPQKGQHAKAI